MSIKKLSIPQSCELILKLPLNIVTAYGVKVALMIVNYKH